MAAVLAGGEGALLSHRSAAALWKLLGPADGPIEVSVPTTSGRTQRAGVRLYRRISLASKPGTRRLGIPVTTPAQTIADLKGVIPMPQWRRAIRQADARGWRIGPEKTHEPTRSELEHLFLQLCERHRLPTPEINVRVGRYEVDFLWRSQQLIVETDGYRYHRGAQAFEDDHARDLDLHSRGYEVRRFTYHQVTEDPRRVATAVHQALQGGQP